MKLTFLICTTTLALATGLHAGSLAPVCMQDTLADYEAGGQCSIGILNYANFTFFSMGTGVNESDSDIRVTPVTDSNSIGGGFLFDLEPIGNPLVSPPFSAPINTTADYYIQYHFDIDPGPIASGTDLEMDPPVGNVTITQTFCLDSQIAYVNYQDGSVVCRAGEFNPNGGDFFNDQNTVQPQSLSVNNNDPLNGSRVAHLDFDPQAQNFGNVLTHINIDSTNTVSGFDAAGSNVSVVTPEPASMLLFLAGISGLCVRRKFMSKT